MYSADGGRTLFMRKEDLREWQRRRLDEGLLEGQRGNKAARGIKNLLSQTEWPI